MLIGTKVKEIAKKKGISLNQLEKDTKIATGSISKWDKISPSFEKVCNVAKALDINVDELTGEESEQMYIQPYYLGLFVGAFGTVAAEIAIVLISNYRDKKRKQKMQERFKEEE